MNDAKFEADKMADEILSLSSKLWKVLGEYRKTISNETAAGVPVMALAIADCICNLADFTEYAYDVEGERGKLLELISKFVKERPNYIKEGKAGVGNSHKGH